MADDTDGYARGPLDDLLPGLRRKAERFRALPVHPRVVHARAPGGARTIVLASFAPATNVRALHAALKPLIEAALLAELSRPASELDDEHDRVVALELYTFAAQPFDVAPALSPFALVPASLDDPDAHRALALLRREAQQVEGTIPDEAIARHRATFASARHPLAAQLAQRLRTSGPKEAWGVKPGLLARSAADALSALGHAGVEPSQRGIERLEQVVLAREPRTIRWIDPLLFQALCDLVAVRGASSPSISVQWGVCEPDEETQLAPPPVLRVERDGDSFHVPLGEHVLRWCVMPAGPSEDIPSLGAWAEHEFA